MAIERKFLEDSIARYLVSSFLKEKLERVGFSSVTIQRTPMVTRITVEVANPGRMIGRKGRTIKKLTDTIAEKFGMANPQIVVVPVEKIELEPALMARAIARRIEGGKPVRPTVHTALKTIVGAGADGAEIVVSGKISAKGGKAKRIRVAHGYLPKAGELTRLVRKAQSTARPKYGAINVVVSIVPPGTFPEKKRIELPTVIKYAEGKIGEKPEERKEEKLEEEKKEEVVKEKAEVEKEEGKGETKEEKGGVE